MVTIPWRIGLGWLVGRWWLLLTTQLPDGSQRHTLLPYRFGGGNFYVPGDGPWMADLDKRTATIQAHPGPRSVRGRVITDPKEEAVARSLGPIPARQVVVFEATGEPAPAMVAPDYVWVWAFVPTLWWARRRLRP